MSKCILILIILSVVICKTTFAYTDYDAKNYGDAAVSDITSIYDGDTFRCTIPALPPLIGEHIRVRIAHIDAPEMDDKHASVRTKAAKAKEFTVAHLRNAKQITLHNMHRDKYFRIVAEVELDGEDLGTLLLKSKLVKPYEGGYKSGW